MIEALLNELARSGLLFAEAKRLSPTTFHEITAHHGYTVREAEEVIGLAHVVIGLDERDIELLTSVEETMLSLAG